MTSADRTFVLIKPDGVSRGLVGQILERFERAGLSIVELQRVIPTREIVSRHYPSDEGWLGVVGGKTLEDYERQNLDPIQVLGTDDAVAIGRMVKEWLIDFLCSGPCIAMVLEGHRSVENVRRLVGATLPVVAAPGTIRGDFALDSPLAANAEGRPVKNLIHASGEPSEALHEINLWFGDR